MALLQLSDVSKYFGSHRIFEHVNLQLRPKEKVGLIGPRDSGKSTLLRILMGLETYQGGKVSLRPWTWVGYLPQNVPGTRQTIGGLFQSAREDYYRIKDESPLQKSPPCFAAAGVSSSRHGLLACHAECDIGPRCSLMINQLGLRCLSPDTMLLDVDPAQRKHVWLASLFLTLPDVLVLDEPTSGFDIPQIEWFDWFIRCYEGAMVIASNDRKLLSNVTDAIWQIDPVQGNVYRLPGHLPKLLCP